MLCGGWSKFHEVNPEEKALFEKTVDLEGAAYEPFACATQIVAGTNYKYLCNATMVTNPPRDFLAEVIIFQPLNSKGIITSIRELD